MPFVKGDNGYIPEVKKYIDDFFSITTGPISTKHGTEHPWVRVIKFFSLKDLACFLRGQIENILTTFENLFQNHWADLNQTRHKVFLNKGNSNLFN